MEFYLEVEAVTNGMGELSHPSLRKVWFSDLLCLEHWEPRILNISLAFFVQV